MYICMYPMYIYLYILSLNIYKYICVLDLLLLVNKEELNISRATAP